MTRDEIFEEIRSSLVSLFDLEAARIDWDSRLAEDLDLDSIDAIDLIIKMQDIAGCRLSQEAMRDIRSVADIVEAVERMGLDGGGDRPVGRQRGLER